MTQNSGAQPPAQPLGPRSFVDKYNIHPLLFVAICLGFIFFVYHILGSGIAFIAVGPKITRENATTMRWLTTAGQLFFILVPTLAFAKLLAPRFRDVFWWRVPGWRETGLMIIALISLQQILEVYLFLQDLIPLPESLQKILTPMREMYRTMLKNVVKAESIPELLFVVAIAAVVPAFVEEMLFRGVVQKTMERLAKPLTAAIVTGIIFGAFHLDPFDAIPLMMIGCFMSLLRWRSKSIVLPIFAHFLNNVGAVIAVYAGMGYETKLTTTGLGISETIAAFGQAAAFGILFAVSFRAYWRTTDSLQTTL